MLKLIMKDFAVQQKTIKRYVVSALLLCIFFWMTDMKQMAFSMAMFPLIYGFLNSTLYEDEKNNTLRLLVSLPIKKETIVYARYISVAIVTVLTGIVFGLINFFIVSSIPNSTDISISENMLVIFSVILVFTVLVSVYLPLAFRMGYIKAAGINRFIMLGIFGAFAAFGVVVKQVAGRGEPPEFLLSIGRFFTESSPAAILAIAFLVVALFYLLSMKLSVKFFKNRNLF